MLVADYPRQSYKTYVNKLFEILVKIGQVVFAPCVFSNEFLLPLQQLLSALLQSFSLGPFVLDSCIHQLVFVIIGVVRMLCEKLFGRDERKLLVFMTGDGGKLAF